MNEANQNDNSFTAKSLFANQGDFWEQQNQVGESPSKSSMNDEKSTLEHYSQNAQNNANLDDPESLMGKMNWQRVAHKLREYNRKLLKKVFRLEQELAEIDNKFNKYVEKSRNTDSLLVSQAEEIKQYQEEIELLVQQVATSQQQIDNQDLVIKQVSEQHELSQQQTAQLERECTLLQEKYNQKAFELVAKEQESQELKSELNQQQHNALQQEAELKRYQEAALRKEKTANRNHNYPHNRFIQPWSTATIPEPKIALPKAKFQSAKIKQTSANTTETIQTAAEIATWSASKVSRTKTEQSKAPQAKTTKSNHSKKPQSLAAVDLPTFPRPQ